MPTNGYDPSSQTVFSPRQSVLPSGYSPAKTGVVSSRTPALRAASAGPSAVRPDGLGDRRESFSETTVVRPALPVDGKRPRGGGWQDKGALGRAPQGTPQPGPDTIVARSSVSDTGSPRSQNHSDAKERLVKGAVWMKPGVHLTLRQLAKRANMSFSATCAEGLEVFARAKIRDQEETLFEPRMQAMMRREIRSSDNRHVPFEIKNAIAAEQTRILITDLYKRMLLKEGMSLKAMNKKLDDTYTMARTNVFNTKTPKFQTLVAQYWQATEDQASDRQGGRQTERAPTREAGNGTPTASWRLS